MMMMLRWSHQKRQTLDSERAMTMTRRRHELPLLPTILALNSTKYPQFIRLFDSLLCRINIVNTQLNFLSALMTDFFFYLYRKSKKLHYAAVRIGAWKGLRGLAICAPELLLLLLYPGAFSMRAELSRRWSFLKKNCIVYIFWSTSQ